MRFKATMLFQLATVVSHPDDPARRIGGWSESYYYEAGSVSNLMVDFHQGKDNQAQSLCARRAALLPTGAAIIGQRFQQLDPVGASKSLSQVFPGKAELKTDVPQMTLLCKVPGVGVINSRQLMLRGIPDIRVWEGEYNPNQVFTAALNSFFQKLSAFRFRGVDQTLPKSKIFTVSETGVINFDGAIPVLAVNDVVDISNCKDLNGKKIKGQFQVKNILPLTGQVEVFNWTHGKCTGGKLRKRVFIYPLMDGPNTTVTRIIVKKVGRPFGQYVGRRSKRS